MNQTNRASEPARGTAALSRRDFLFASAASTGGILLPAAIRAAASPSAVPLFAADPWAPHTKAAPITNRQGDAFTINANGTRTCTGGWQWRYDGIVAGQAYEVLMEARHAGIAVPRDALSCVAIWGAPKPAQSNPGAIWDYLLPIGTSREGLHFRRRIVAPPNSRQLTLRATLRWTATGQTTWQIPNVVAVAPAPKREPLRISVVTGAHAQRLNRSFKSPRENVEFYGELCEAACRRDRPGLLVLPEVALQWGVRGHALDLAVPAPGPEIDAFAEIARRHHVRIGVGMYERDGDAVYNSLVLLNPSGTIDGRYRKVHLAHGEDLSGVLPGDEFPVFNTEAGRIGCNICMDSMAPESARMVGLNGADFLLLPIMGDFRADRWDMGPPVFNEDRWRTIMRAQALDNQLSMVVARNRSVGSCIVSRKGDFLAWNNGDQPFITAEVPWEDDYRSWNGSCFRDSAWLVRRPHLYGAFDDLANHGNSV